VALQCYVIRVNPTLVCLDMHEYTSHDKIIPTVHLVSIYAHKIDNASNVSSLTMHMLQKFHEKVNW